MLQQSRICSSAKSPRIARAVWCAARATIPTSPASLVVPHAPQLPGWLVVSTHAVPQSVCPAGQDVAFFSDVVAHLDQALLAVGQVGNAHQRVVGDPERRQQLQVTGDDDVGQRGKSLMTKYGNVAAISVGAILAPTERPAPQGLGLEPGDRDARLSRRGPARPVSRPDDPDARRRGRPRSSCPARYRGVDLSRGAPAGAR